MADRRQTSLASAGGGGPGDLASMIAAKAASRKPMATSPTRKEFQEGGEGERFSRRSTVSNNSSAAEAARYMYMYI